MKNRRSPPHPDTFNGRPTCFQCMRPASHCVCNLVTPFHAHFNVLILQHPHERKKYHGTAKLVLKGIKNSKLLGGLQFDQAELEKECSPGNTFLLFPGESAVDGASAHLKESSTVIVIDGTWSEAGKIVRRNPVLQTLPTLTFTQELRSRYRIRKQPRNNYLSTVECVAHLLKLNAPIAGHLEKIPEYDRLLAGFDTMVEQQLSHYSKQREFF